ncbi:MAG: ABC transporter permease [Ferruginibacter sp.]
MQKLLATIRKDMLILTRDRLGLIFMFIMPIILAIVIAAVQNSTFEIVNKNKVPLLLCNKDTGQVGRQLVTAIDKIGMFDIRQVTATEDSAQLASRMHAKDALVAIIIPSDYSVKTVAACKVIVSKALQNFGMQTDPVTNSNDSILPIIMLYHPVLQDAFRRSVNGALYSALQMVQSRQVLKNLYFSLNEKELPDTLENQILHSQVSIRETPISRDGSKTIPNATQHNIPAWTIFAMFFIVISLGGSVVREKLSGSFVRLKTLPTNYLLALVSKQITYLCITLLQVAVVFSIGIWLFPSMGLPQLNLPADMGGLFIVSLICGWCAVSFAICIGVFAQTQEQSNGTGAVLVVLMAALGGLMVPAFAMPQSMQGVLKLSPMHWCLEAYYGLFLEGGKLKDVIPSLLPLLGIIVFFQLLMLYGLKRKKLI